MSSSLRTLLYPEECPILMRTEMGHKTGLSPILMSTESVNFGRRSDPFWVHKWPVGSDVRSHLRTFWGRLRPELANLEIFRSKILLPALDLRSSSPSVFGLNTWELFFQSSGELCKAVKTLQAAE